jgi:hypothetical protein
VPSDLPPIPADFASNPLENDRIKRFKLTHGSPCIDRNPFILNAESVERATGLNPRGSV